MTIMVMVCVSWNMITVFQAVFQNGGGNSCSCGMPFTSVPTVAISETATVKVMALNKDRHVFFRTGNMKNSSTILIVIFVLALPVLVPWSRCDASICVLNKRIDMNSSSSSNSSNSTRTDSSLLAVLGLMDSIHLYPVSIDHLARYCSTNASAPVISPHLNTHTTSTETLVANAWITFLPFLSSLSKVISVNTSGSLPASSEVGTCYEIVSLLPVLNSLWPF